MPQRSGPVERDPDDAIGLRPEIKRGQVGHAEKPRLCRIISGARLTAPPVRDIVDQDIVIRREDRIDDINQANEFCIDPCFFMKFAQRSSVRCLARLNPATWKRPLTLPWRMRPADQKHLITAQADYADCRDRWANLCHDLSMPTN